jgi:hypothetical protein
LLDQIIYVSRANGTLDLHWVQTLSAGEVKGLARRTQREYEVRGWTLTAEAAGDGDGAASN